MPTYQYRCQKCDTTFERTETISEHEAAKPQCPKCGSKKVSVVPVPSENLIRWIRSRKENRIMIETDGDRLQTSARIYVGLLSFA